MLLITVDNAITTCVSVSKLPHTSVGPNNFTFCHVTVGTQVVMHNQQCKDLEIHTLFIATIALVAPFIPVEIDVLAYKACEMTNKRWLGR